MSQQNHPDYPFVGAHTIRQTSDRPAKGGWAPGPYFNICRNCDAQFIGDKRAWRCAVCEYGSPEPGALPPLECRPEARP